MFLSHKTLSATDLLKTNSLTREQVIKRLHLIENLKGKVEFNEKQQEKLEKLINKCKGSNSEENQEFGKTESEKYLSNEELSQLYINLRNGKASDLKIREPRTEIRTTKGAEKLKEIVRSKTKIIKIDEDHFTVKYPDDSDSVIPDANYIEFLFGIKFEDNKVKFVFERTFQGANPEKMNSQDRLYPEEIQITMLKKLIKENPEILEKIKSARKINCIQATIINEKTLLGVSKYVELRIKEPDNLESKKHLSSTPNQSNTENFMNQLIHEFGIGILDSTPPSVLYESKINVALKKTYIIEGGR